MSKASEFLATVSGRPRFRSTTFGVELSDSGNLVFFAANGDRLPLSMSEQTAKAFEAWLHVLYGEEETA